MNILNSFEEAEHLLGSRCCTVGMGIAEARSQGKILTHLMSELSCAEGSILCVRDHKSIEYCFFFQSYELRARIIDCYKRYTNTGKLLPLMLCKNTGNKEGAKLTMSELKNMTICKLLNNG